ncbi:hypothetical protein GQ55_5G002300 [Panicum hallii var. hallii]|uniref:Kinetochore protein SPC25 n=1 Tax=Panicum hallii var. hallii TaxID=1504633 RepID=A0A2T7DB37_9POAL|nr:hypothetical protein GQ55_5G002300 [Panicum hallii var. hallii]
MLMGHLYFSLRNHHWCKGSPVPAYGWMDGPRAVRSIHSFQGRHAWMGSGPQSPAQPSPSVGLHGKEEGSQLPAAAAAAATEIHFELQPAAPPRLRPSPSPSPSSHHHPTTGTMADAEASFDLRRRMQDQRAAMQRRIAHARDRTAATADAFSAALLSARSIANQTVSNRAQLNELKQQLRKLEADLAQALSVQTSKRSKHKLMGDSILNTTATNEQLRSLVMDQRARRDEYVNAISNQLQAIESLEAESDAKGDKNLEKAIMWYNKFLGFQVVGGEGVRFVFNKIDVQSPDKEYSFCIKLIEERYILVQCVPSVDGSEELVKDLNCNNDLYKFVRTVRERFQIATISGSGVLSMTKSYELMKSSGNLLLPSHVIHNIFITLSLIA